ncbi:hypothetical protein PV326_006228, partial [Microctonus aethiopoides]
MNIYIARIQKLFTDLKELLRNSDVPNKDPATRVLKHAIIKGYVRGLQPKYLIHFTTKSFIDLASALAVGRRVEQELSEILQLYFDNCFERKDHLEGREATRPQRFHPESFTSPGYNIFCNYCKHTAHIIQECRTRMHDNQMRLSYNNNFYIRDVQQTADRCIHNAIEITALINQRWQRLPGCSRADTQNVKMLNSRQDRKIFDRADRKF